MEREHYINLASSRQHFSIYKVLEYIPPNVLAVEEFVCNDRLLEHLKYKRVSANFFDKNAFRKISEQEYESIKNDAEKALNDLSQRFK